MKKLSIIAILFLSVLLFSCNSGENKSNKNSGDSTNTEGATENFETYWKNFQTAVAANDKDAVYSLCDDYVVEQHLSNSYDLIFCDEVKKNIAIKKASEIEVLPEGKKQFSYTIVYSDEPNEYVSNESLIQFTFENVEGKWSMTDLNHAG